MGKDKANNFTGDEREVAALYQRLLAAWNRRNARDFASLLSSDAIVVGFDGSTMVGPPQVETTLAEISRHHPTAAYVHKIRNVRLLAPETALLSAVAGMVPPGKSQINPAVNAIHSLVAVKRAGRWEIALFQSTPAAFHGRPEEAAKLTEELNEILRQPTRE
jgi:uncharacterized protein (TIGR02246 family)